MDNTEISPKQKYENKICDSKMTFEECELAILRHAVDETDKIKKEDISNSEDVKKMIEIVENFLRQKKCVCYGGTAINNILPKHAQFYNRDIEIPDYDFYSSNALSDAKELADIFFAAGYTDVEAKSGVHHGTYKVFVNFIPMADLTEIHASLFKSLSKDAVVIQGIHYAPPEFLRMNMFIELSRPKGDVSRWEKVLKRLNLLNEYYPLKTPESCSTVDFQRKMDSHTSDSDKIYFIVRDTFIEQEVIFFGGYASSLYSKYMPPAQKRQIQQIPDFDVLSEDMEQCAAVVKQRLETIGKMTNVQIIRHPELGEVIPKHIEIRVDREIIAFIYEPIACHNYNIILLEPEDNLKKSVEANRVQSEMRLHSKEIRVATIDTMLSFYLAFLYADAPYYYKDRILCMAKFLFDVEQQNRLNQNGLLKRFSIDCYGKQPTLETIRAEKSEMYKKLKSQKNSTEYERWFLRYNPSEKPSLKNSGKNSNRVGTLKTGNKMNGVSKSVRPRRRSNSSSRKTTKTDLYKLFRKKTQRNRRKKDLWII